MKEKTKKTISKSIRISDDMFNYINGSPGSGFNEKLENIILREMDSDSEQHRKLEYLAKKIDEEEKKLNLLVEKNCCLHDFFEKVNAIQTELESYQIIINNLLHNDLNELIKEIKGDLNDEIKNINNVY